jgi:hypothetical protein
MGFGLLFGFSIFSGGGRKGVSETREVASVKLHLIFMLCRHGAGHKKEKSGHSRWKMKNSRQGHSLPRLTASNTLKVSTIMQYVVLSLVQRNFQRLVPFLFALGPRGDTIRSGTRAHCADHFSHHRQDTNS